MRSDLPQLQEAVSRGAILTSEMEVFFEVCPCRIIAVTGSDGKTTTTTIIAKLLESAGYNTYLGGNIGKPLLTDAIGMEPGDVAVVELSSFQLMTMKRSPSIAVVTNLAPNHLDVHTSMGEYVAAKENIFMHQTAEDKVVLNYDNDITRGFGAEVPGGRIWFSRKERMDPGVCVRD
ncbi:MAG: UDP-N-acetylmuramoyl-L-alanine--D-glutamate ligase, partial [Lentisphaeria bacterium]|nr:UDP-N-acetylmuramoyl-L-alanine--D-glutamate ligase [Lentisphaeria bacterium]